ncbi:cyclin-domain-containing protein [Absidia repens]|uniref:Cyclin-domain-containing protein n=1 Tax=Absidia repens TaxID=90262 RepID=A0A1X2J1L7_9FUNG|nr:cyclin-domain-containing protein [Absidia repens]
MATSIHSGEQQTTSSTILNVPEYFYAVDINYLSHMIADMLGRLITHNDLIPLTPANLTRFHSRIPPNITLSDYLRRIIKFTSIEKSCLLIILIYIDRVCERHSHFTISSLTVHRFLITAVTLSSKALSDSYCTNSHYARIGGISTQELNALELEFLTLIDWRLTSTGVVLQQYYANLVNQHPCYQRSRLTTHDMRTLQSPVTYNNSMDGNTTESHQGSKRKEDNNNNSSNKCGKRRRRRSSIKSICSTSTALSTEDSDDIWYDSDEDDENKLDDVNDGTDETTGDNNNGIQDETEVQRIWAHFDELSETTWIPYIA